MSMTIKFCDNDRTIFQIEANCIPSGAEFRECYETETEIVVCGEISRQPDHNCDEMGCSTVNHVLYRFKK